MSRLIITTQEKLDQLVAERVARATAMQDDQKQLEILKKQADIAMLQAQINPHFLYNTLECIRGQAILSDVPDIASVAEALSGFFRYSISTREDIVSLREELLNVQNYVNIQKYRFRDRFELYVDINKTDAELTGNALPKLTLQPLVENAIVHGLSSQYKPGAFIRITAETTLKHINLHVIDNGIGIDPDALKRLLAELADLQAPINRVGHGIALINVHRRLVFMFGAGYGLNISSRPEMGTDVEIHIPRCLPTEIHTGVS